MVEEKIVCCVRMALRKPVVCRTLRDAVSADRNNFLWHH
jgi:hypothetical protein